jgi:hypothetical protein
MDSVLLHNSCSSSEHTDSAAQAATMLRELAPKT